MLVVIHKPRLELREFVDRFWFYEGLSPIHKLERVLPDGTFTLCINLRSEPRHIYERGSHRPVASYRHAWFSGAHRRHIVIDTGRDSSMMGAHFKVGGAACVLGMPAGELLDQVVELDALGRLADANLRDALLEAPSPEAKFNVLEDFLLCQARRNGARKPALHHAVNSLTNAPNTASISALATELGISHKHLIEQFRDEVGLTPKRFCRIQRFQEVLRAIEARRGVEWADIACACGYFDQAHFIHEFHEFSGLNPSAYLAQRGEYLNFVPVGERG